MYREFYDIPKDLWVRKEDPMMRLAVSTSTALARAEKLRVRSMNPSLVYFDNRLQEHQIKKCVQILQGDSIDKEKKVKYDTVLKEISDLLLSNKP